MSSDNNFSEIERKSVTSQAEKSERLNLIDITAHQAAKPVCNEDIATKQLSSVGHYLSTRVEKEGDCTGAAHPYSVHKFSTIDKDTTEPVTLTDIFSSSDIFKALMNDKVVSKALSDANLHPRNFYELKKHLSTEFIPVSTDINGNEIGSALNEKILTDFAFHHLDKNGKNVAVRLLMDYSGEASRGSAEQLGILLPVPEELKQDLIDASNKKHGFLMKDSITEGKERHFSRTFPF